MITSREVLFFVGKFSFVNLNDDVKFRHLFFSLALLSLGRMRYAKFFSTQYRRKRDHLERKNRKKENECTV